MYTSDNFFFSTLLDYTGAWWEVDLEGYFDIESVIIRNRDDCCQKELSNTIVSLLSDSGKVIGSHWINEVKESVSIMALSGSLFWIVSIFFYFSRFQLMKQ